MAQTIPDEDKWEAVVVATPGNQAEKDQWGTISNGAFESLTDRTFYALKRLELLNGGAVTGVTPVGLAGISDVNSSITPSEGTLLTYVNGQWDATAPSTGTTVDRAGSDTLSQLLTVNQQSFETDTTGWAAGSNCSISRSTVQAKTGIASLMIESLAAGTMNATTLTGTNGIPCVAGEVYTTSGYSRAQSVARAVSIGFIWYNGAGTLLSTTYGTAINNSSSDFNTQVIHQATAPANAEFFAITFRIASTGSVNEQHYIDDISARQVLVPRGKLSFFGSVLDDSTNDAIQLYSGGGRRINVTSNYTVKVNDDGAKIEVDTTSGAVTITLPSGYRDGLEVSILKVAGANDVTVTADGTLQGASGTITGLNTGLRVYVNGATTWRALPFSGGGIGSLIQAASAPTDGTWLACDGSVYLQATYSALFEKIGLIYDTSGDATTTGGALSGGASGSNIAANAFNDSPAQIWQSSQTGASVPNNAWIGNNLSTSQTVTTLIFSNSTDVNRQPTAIDIQGADDAAFSTNVATYTIPSGEIVQTGSASWTIPIPPASQFTRQYVRAIARAQTPAAGFWYVAELEIITQTASYNTVTEFVVPDFGFTLANNMYIKAAN